MAEESVALEDAYDMIEDGSYTRELFLNRFELFRDTSGEEAIVYDVEKDDFTRLQDDHLYGAIRRYFGERERPPQTRDIAVSVEYELDGCPHEYRDLLEECQALNGSRYSNTYQLPDDNLMTLTFERNDSSADTIKVTAVGTGHPGQSLPDDLFEDLVTQSVTVREQEGGPWITGEFEHTDNTQNTDDTYDGSNAPVTGK